MTKSPRSLTSSLNTFKSKPLCIWGVEGYQIIVILDPLYTTMTYPSMRVSSSSRFKVNSTKEIMVINLKRKESSFKLKTFQIVSYLE
jgi:hypothetical protein